MKTQFAVSSAHVCEAHFCDCIPNMAHFLCGLERVRCFMNVRLRCFASNQKNISKMSTLPLHLEKFLRTPMVGQYLSQN